MVGEVKDDDAKQHPDSLYTTTLGPGELFEAKNIWGGSFTFAPGAMYGVGNRAVYEIYIVTSGSANFYNYDKKCSPVPAPEFTLVHSMYKES